MEGTEAASVTGSAEIEEPDWKRFLVCQMSRRPPLRKRTRRLGYDDDRSDEELREAADGGDETALELVERREREQLVKREEEDASERKSNPQNRGRAPETSKHRQGPEGYVPHTNDDDIVSIGARRLEAPCYVQDQGPPIVGGAHDGR